MSTDEFLEKLNIVLDRPGMYGIQKIEDISMIFFCEIFFHRNIGIEDWSSRFSRFVTSDINADLSNFDWWKVIRLYSGSNNHSIELFKELYARFIRETK